MTDRISGLTVTFENDIREDDVQALIMAISMLRGVLSVKMHVNDVQGHFARERARNDMRKAIFSVIDKF